MKVLAACTMSGLLFTQFLLGAGMKASHESSVETYKHLATSIIEIRATEDNLVKGILQYHHASAHDHMEAAMGGTDSKVHLEAAAEEIANIANEGDKPVQAIRQQLLKAGHHHHTDADTKEDYMFIDSKEKAALIEMSGRVARLAEKASDSEIRAVSSEFDKLFGQAIAPE